MPEYYDPNAWMSDFEPELQTFDFQNSLNDLVDMPDYNFDLGDGYSDSPMLGGTSGGGGSSPNLPWYQDVWNFVRGNWRDLLGAGMSLGSGAIGLSQADQLRDLASQAFGQSDPFASQRGQYQQQLAALMQNPSSFLQDPTFQASLDVGRQGVERSLAARGLLESGNAAIELQDYGQSRANEYLNQRIAQLSGLAGAGIAPNFGAALGGYGAGAGLTSEALAALGYGVGTLTGMGQPGRVTAGGAGGLTPASGQQRPFSSAGGEAASLAQWLRLGAGATNLIGGLSDTDLSSISAPLSGASAILGGVARGDTAGYLGAARAGTSLAGRYGADWAGTAGQALGAVGSGLNFYEGIQNVDINNPIGTINTAASGARLAGSIASLTAPGALSAGGSIATGAAANAALAEAGFGTAGAAGGAGAGAAGTGAAAGIGAAATALGVAGAVIAAPAIIGSFASRGQRERAQEVEQWYASGAVNRMGIGTSFTNIQLPDGRVLVNPTRDNQVELARAYASGDMARYNSELDRVFRESSGSYQMRQGDPRWRQPGTVNTITPTVSPTTGTGAASRPTTPRTQYRE